MHPVSRSSFSLAEDYPEPLTQSQRNAFQRYLFSQIHQYRQINKTFTLIQKGLISVKKVTDRLQSEKLYLTTSLEKVAVTAKGSSQPPEASPRPTSSECSLNSGTRGTVRRRGFARLAMIQSALRSAEEEEASKADVVAKREKITREIRLAQVEKDLEAYRPRCEQLQGKYDWCVTEIAKRKDTLFPLMTLYDEMLVYEPAYSSAFSFRAVGATVPVNGSAVACFREVPFKPAVITPGGEAILRAQIEEVLNGYVAYRSKIDYVLAQLDEEQQHKKTERINELMDLIGSTGSEEVHETSMEVPRVNSDARILEISDSSGDDEADGGDEADRRLVESALTALNDFQDLY